MAKDVFCRKEVLEMRLQKKFEYKWVILCVCFMMEFLCLGFCSSNAGMYLTAITEALGFERSLYSLNTSLRHVTTIIISLFFGTLVHKFGTKKLNCVGLLALIASTLTFAYADALYQFYIGGALLGVGVVFTGSTMASTIIRQWFDKDVGKYTGIALAANGIGGAVAAQIIAPFIYSEDPFGYRTAYKISTLAVVVISIVIIVLIKEPADRPIITAKKSASANWQGLPYKDVQKKSYFYLMAILIFLNGICLESIGNAGVAHLKDCGIDGDFIAATSTVASLILTFAKVFVGVVYDKKGLRFTLITCHVIMVVSLVMMLFSGGTTVGKACAVGALVLSRLALPIETVMIPLISADMFGSNALVNVMGVFVASKSAGGCIDAPLCNLAFDLTGSYIPIFVFFTVMMIIVAISIQLVINMAYKDKENILTIEQST